MSSSTAGEAEALLSVAAATTPSPLLHKMGRTFKVAMCQLTSNDQVEHNLQVAQSLVARIARQYNDGKAAGLQDQVRFICFPENAGFLGDTVKMLSSSPGLTNERRIEPFLRLAKDHGERIRFRRTNF